MNIKDILSEQSTCPDGYIQISTVEALKLNKLKSGSAKKHGNKWCKIDPNAVPVTPRKQKPVPPAPPAPPAPAPAKPEEKSFVEIQWKPEQICKDEKWITKGVKGAIVEVLQKKLGISVTGNYDDDTISKVKLYQEKNEIFPDGVVNGKTWSSIFKDTPYACEKKKLKHPDDEFVRTIKGESLKKIKLLEQDRFQDDGELKSVPLTKSVNPKDIEKEILENVLNSECIDNLQGQGFTVAYEEPVIPKGTDKFAIIGFFKDADSSTNVAARLLSNNTIVDTNNKVLINWKCPSLEKPESSNTCTATSRFLDYRQKEYISTYLAKHKEWTCQTPSDYEISKGLWEFADLGEQVPNLFKDKKGGPFFLYKKVGSVSTTKNILSQVDAWLLKQGWTRNEPDFGSEVDKSTIFDLYGKEISGIKNQPIWRNQIINPTDVLNTNAKDLAKNMRYNRQPQKDYCKQGVILLHNASLGNSGYKYFDNATDIATVRDYVYRCMQGRIITPNKNSLGVGKKLYELTRRNYGPEDASRFYLGNYGAQTYTENVLSKTIKKKLLEMLEKKKLIS